ncbi:MAG: RNA-binding S4 domain-containing protein [Nitrospiraceae bacterium]|nr:RNA-binding S4 domain-containing protein [Nitrospiraceae bacterium]
MRLDLYLKTSRLIKRRTLAKELCDAGRVLVNGREGQPATEIRPGDRIEVRYASRAIVVEVLVVPADRRPVAADSLYRIVAETRTPREEFPL